MRCPDPNLSDIVWLVCWYSVGAFGTMAVVTMFVGTAPLALGFVGAAVITRIIGVFAEKKAAVVRFFLDKVED